MRSRLGGRAIFTALSRIFRIGKQPMNASFQYFYNLEEPDIVGDWSIRLQLQFMFPKSN